jgi:choline kinase
MSRRPEIAVILAAGRGRRLRALGRSQPKGFLRLGELPIVEESVLRLVVAGIRKVVIVTGHCAEHYVNLAQRHRDKLTLVNNPSFADSGSMHSLYLARPYVNGDFLLLESDLIYEQRALAQILINPEANVLLMSGKTGAGDEVYVEVWGNLLRGLSKERARPDDGTIREMVGISRISLNYYEAMIRLAQCNSEHPTSLEYEQVLASVARKIPLHCLLVEDLLWSEIDDENQLERARNYIYPAITTRDSSLNWRYK